MDVFKAIETRRSIRKYQGRPIPDDLMNKISRPGGWPRRRRTASPGP